MTGKRNSKLVLITSIVLTIILCLGMALPVFAEKENYSEGESSTKPAKAALTKVFNMPAGTTTPKAEFIFKFVKVGMNDPLDSATETKNKMPDIPDVKISYTAGEEPAGGTFVNGDTKSVVKESDNFLKDITSDMWENDAGIYKYKVYEDSTDGNSSITLSEDAINQGTAYSKAEYDVEIWVDEEEDEDGNGTGIFYPKYVCVKIIPGSKDEYYTEEGTPGDGKVDPTPGEDKKIPGTPSSIENDFSHVIFTNKYWESNGGGEEKPKITALEIIKKITGNGSEPDKYFDFTVKVTQPSVIPLDPDATPDVPAQKYKAYVLDKEGKIVTSGKNYSGTLSQDAQNEYYIEFISGAPLVISLTNEQRLAFVDLHIGSDVEVTEAAALNYIPKYQRTFAGERAYKAPDDTMAWGFPRIDEDDGPHIIAAGNNNIVTFTNARTGATPTGISVNDLPYIMLIAIGILSFAGFIIYKSRKTIKNDVQA